MPEKVGNYSDAYYWISNLPLIPYITKHRLAELKLGLINIFVIITVL